MVACRKANLWRPATFFLRFHSCKTVPISGSKATFHISFPKRPYSLGPLSLTGVNVYSSFSSPFSYVLYLSRWTSSCQAYFSLLMQKIVLDQTASQNWNWQMAQPYHHELRLWRILELLNVLTYPSNPAAWMLPEARTVPWMAH